MARSRSFSVTLGATSTPVVGPNERRIGVWFSAPASGRYSIAFGEAAVLDSGITIHAGQVPVFVTYDSCCDDVKQAITAIHSVGAVAVGFREISNP